MTKARILGLAIAMALALTALPGVAAAAGPGFFVADSYPTTIKGTATGETGKLITKIGTSLCASPEVEGALSKNSATVATSVKYLGASCINMNSNGCEFTFHAPSEGINGSFDIGGAKCTALTAQQAGTPIAIPAQSGLAATFENEGTGTGAKIKIKAQAAIKYEVLSGEMKGTYTGTYQTMWSAAGAQGGSAVGIRTQPSPGLTVVNSGEGPEFHSDLYPATISGAQLGANKVKFTTDAGTITCQAFNLSSSTWAPSGIIGNTSELVLAPTAKECVLAGVEVSMVPVTDCNYTFAVTGSSPFVGTLYACQTQFKTSGSKCVVTVTGNTGSGVEYVNLGSGSSATVEAKLNLSGTPYQVSGGKYCPNTVSDGSYVNGKIKGSVSLSAQA